jgi:hypothetical protein
LVRPAFSGVHEREHRQNDRSDQQRGRQRCGYRACGSATPHAGDLGGVDLGRRRGYGRPERGRKVAFEVVHHRLPSVIAARNAAFDRRVAKAQKAWLLTVPTLQRSVSAVACSLRSAK